MSRTDKDVPIHVAATRWKATHSLRCQWDSEPCDLPPEPDVRRYRSAGRALSCSWQPVWDRKSWYLPVPGEFKRFLECAQRQAARMDCLRAVAEHRASGEVDIIPTVRQHRHNARWLWW